MASMNVAALNAAFKQLIDPKVTPQYEDELNMSLLIKKASNPEFLGAKGFRITADFDRPTGHVRGGEALVFRASGTYSPKEMYVTSIQYGFPGEITGRTIRNLKSGAAIVNYATAFLSKYKAAQEKDWERAPFVGNEGTRAVVASTAGATITCETAGAATANRTKGAVWLDLGETYDVISSAGVNRGSCTVTQTGPVTITVDAVPGGTVAGDILVHKNSYNNHETGLPALINNDTGVIQQLSRATNPKLKSVVVDLNNATVTVATITKIKTLGKNRRGTKSKAPMLAIGPCSQMEILINQGHQLVRYDPKETTYGTQLERFAVGSTLYHEVVDCDEDRIYFPDLESEDGIRWYEEMAPGPYDEDGLMLRQKPGTGNGADDYYLAWGRAGNFGSKRFDCHFLIKRCEFASASTQVASYQ